MFVYYYVHLDRAPEEAEPVVSRLLDGVSEAAEIAYREGEELRMRAGIGGRTPAKTVRVEVGPTVHLNGAAAVPLTWEATGASGLFPRMEGELILAPLGPGNTQISFRGTYKPPLGAVGEVLDRALLHRVAEATVKNFVDRVRHAIVDWPVWRDAELKMTDAG
jgi:hypothetical protein